MQVPQTRSRTLGHCPNVDSGSVQQVLGIAEPQSQIEPGGTQWEGIVSG